MATTKTTYTGNGTNRLFSFSFPYFFPGDIKVQLNGVNTTAYTFANATTIETTTAPAAGVVVTVYRDTGSDAMVAEFYPGSAIRAQDLNDDYSQILYVVQEAETLAAETNTTSLTALTTANSATASANTAVTTANAATSTSNAAISQSSAAVNTANTASANASAAVSTANTAATNATTAISTANSASTAAASAVTTANAATATANSAASNAAASVSTANAANASSTSAVSTANTANTNASAAVTTAGTASSNASTALSTANTANTKADQAISAVSNSINYTLVANVAGIPASPANDTYVEVGNSTGIESFTPLAGKPAGFVGDSGLSVRIRYTTAGATWNWQNYYPNNSESRYLKLTGGTLTGNITLAGAPSSNLHPATKDYVDSADGAKLDTATAASTYQPLSGMSSYLTTATAASTYLTTATAGTTYQTQAGMSNYLPTSSFATQAEAVAGTSSTTVMTPQRTLQAIQANPTGVSLGLAIALG